MVKGNTPVIVGVAQRTWHKPDRERTPHDGLYEVAQGALADCASPKVLGAIDALAQVPFLLTQEPALAPMMPDNAGAELARRLGINPAQYTAVAGGNLPQEFVNTLAASLLRGEHRVALLCGAEMLNTLLGGLRAGEPPPDWSADAEGAARQLNSDADAYTAAPEIRHGLREPIAAYPLFESALRSAAGRSIAAHQQHIGEIVSRMSEVAVRNPLAWKQERWSAEAVNSTANGNRWICHPYTKIMNAIIAVDMAACAILTTAATARELGVPEERWVYLRGAADAHDCWFMSERADLHRSPALAVVADEALSQSALDLDDMSYFDLYSCFPSAVQVACDALGLAHDDPRGVTVTGGLNLFGGPGNNYSLHAVAEMVQRLREEERGAGLVSANGAYLTKHSVGIYSRCPPEHPWSPPEGKPLQAKLDSLPRRRLADRGEGTLTIDACTVRYQRGEAQTGIVLGTLADGRRCLAHSEDDPAVLARLATQECVGVSGRVVPDGDVNRFYF